MKICIVSQTFAPQHEGGAEIVSRVLAAELSKRHDIVVLSLGMVGTAVGLGEVRSSKGYRVIRIPFKNGYLPEAKAPTVSLGAKALWHLKNAIGALELNAVRNLFLREKFDLIYCHNASRMQPAVFQVASQLNIPVCQHLHDYALMCPRASMYKAGINCAKPCAECRVLTARSRHASMTVGTVIAVSDFVKQRFLANGLFETADWHVLHNDNLSSSDLDAALIKARPAATDRFTFGYLGAISEVKGVEGIVTAFMSLPEELPVRLVLGGQGNSRYTDWLKKKTRHLPAGRVEWLGHIRREQVLSQSEVIIVASAWHEPQSLVLIESATYGLPVIAARTGGSPEIVEGKGTGWCFDAGNTVQLSELMLRAAGNGATAWREQIKGLFPGLDGFKGTAEASGFYARLEEILESAARRRV